MPHGGVTQGQHMRLAWKRSWDYGGAMVAVTRHNVVPFAITQNQTQTDIISELRGLCCGVTCSGVLQQLQSRCHSDFSLMCLCVLCDCLALFPPWARFLWSDVSAVSLSSLCRSFLTRLVGARWGRRHACNLAELSPVTGGSTWARAATCVSPVPQMAPPVACATCTQ